MKSKACTKCGAVKPLSEFGKKSAKKDGLDSWCKKCCYEYSKKYRKKYQEKIEEKNAYLKKYYTENRERASKYNKERRTGDMAVCYIKQILVSQGFVPDQITPELIELKREQLEMTRLAKQLKQAIKDNQECPT